MLRNSHTFARVSTDTLVTGECVYYTTITCMHVQTCRMKGLVLEGLMPFLCWVQCKNNY